VFPVFFIKQKDGSLCLVKGLLKAQCDDSEECLPPPLIPDILNKISKAEKPSIFTKLDVSRDTTMCRSKREMSGKLPSGQTEAFVKPLVMFFSLTKSPMNLPDDDEWHFHLWWSDQITTPWDCGVSPQNPPETPYLKAEKCTLLAAYGWIPWPHPVRRSHGDRPGSSCWCPGLAKPPGMWPKSNHS